MKTRVQSYVAATRARFFGLGRRLVIFFGGLIACFSIIGLLVNESTQRRMIEARLESRASALSEMLSEVATSYLFDFKVSDLEIILENMYEQSDIIGLYVVDNAGIVVANGDTEVHNFFEINEDPLVLDVMDSALPAQQINPDSIAIATPAILNGEILGVVRLQLSLETYKQDLAQVWFLNGLIGALFLIAGIFTSILIAGRLTRQLSKLINASQAVTDGNLDHEIEMKTNDEVELLANSFSQMLRALRKSLKEVNHLAFHDKLTGLANRAWFTDYLETISTQLSKRKCNAAVLFLDLDRFKLVNDTLGHDVGDQLLVNIAERLVQIVENTGWRLRATPDLNTGLFVPKDGEAVVARLGGDEFTIVLFGRNAEVQAEFVARAIIEGLSASFSVENQTLQSSASIGLAYMPTHARDSGEITKLADIAMYQAKQAGRNVYRVFDAEMAAMAEDRMRMEKDLRIALQEGQLVAFFQPQFDVGTENLVGAEALVRWEHPRRGLLLPGQFLPVAESAGIMPDLGRYMLSRALDHAVQWPTVEGESLSLALNMGVEELSDRSNLDFIFAELAFHGFDPEQLEIEITEGTAMEDDEALDHAFKLLKSARIRLSVDDFGVGYSNLARLKALEFETLKINRGLMEGVGVDPGAEALVSSILQMARSLGLKVVAEGIENHDQMDFLKQAGCEFAQGYALGRPMTAEDFQQFASQMRADRSADGLPVKRTA